jgi:L-amino acid N-acyltransferase YncA
MMRSSAGSVSVRDSTDAGAASIAAIYAHHVLRGPASFEMEPRSVAEMTKRRTDILSRGLPYLVAEQDGSVLGYTSAGPYRPSAAYRYTVEDSIYLRPDEIGQGIGRHILHELIIRCTAVGMRQMIAVVGDGASVASIRLHESFGFRVIGVLRAVGRKHERWLDSVLLQRPLGPGDATPPL